MEPEPCDSESDKTDVMYSFNQSQLSRIYKVTSLDGLTWSDCSTLVAPVELNSMNSMRAFVVVCIFNRTQQNLSLDTSKQMFIGRLLFLPRILTECLISVGL